MLIRELDEGGVTHKITNSANGSIQLDEYFLQGTQIYHREDGPAFTSYHRNGQLKCEFWIRNGQYHREDFGSEESDRCRRIQPAFRIFYENGILEEEAWFYEGKLHRSVSDGAALIYYYRTGQVQSQKFFNNGNFLDNAHHFY